MPTPGAPTTKIFTSEREDFFLLTCLMARMPLLELIVQIVSLSLCPSVFVFTVTTQYSLAITVAGVTVVILV